ncbi:hypothetical protein HF086_000328 [Spodoptera exigua]|uniref:Uncharacterized protein n=1 Tax=Spodoptera exigua TaxID=7107 RepID=A0A922SPD0_SPOEX|nr:hypothetical protein HF086_000328 [Spodoptera exigua]
MYNLNNSNLDFNVLAGTSENEDCQEVAQNADENILRVEVENTNEWKNLESKTQELVLVVQSSVTAQEVTLACNEAAPDDVSAVLVSAAPSLPRLVAATEAGLSADSPQAYLSEASPPLSHRGRSESPDQASHFTRNDALDADPNQQTSNSQMQLELSKEVLDNSVSDYGKGEYADDFSADVDNYNSRSDYENHSPISLPKTSEDENFWDS